MKPIRVALSGSGFKFPAHVGALRAILDAGYTPIEYAGTSGGSIIAGLAACGMDIDDMQQLCMEQDWSGMMSFSLMAAIDAKSFCDGHALSAWLVTHTAGKTFADLSVDLTIMSSDVSRMQPFRWARDTTPDALVALAARASASIPVVFEPVLYAGVTHQDGGMANNIPVIRLKQDGVPRFGIDLTVKASALPEGTVDSLSLLARDLDLMLTSNESTQVLMGLASGATIAYIETGYASGLDRNMSRDVRRRLLQDGYDGAKAILARNEALAVRET